MSSKAETREDGRTLAGAGASVQPPAGNVAMGGLYAALTKLQDRGDEFGPRQQGKALVAALRVLVEPGGRG